MASLNLSQMLQKIKDPAHRLLFQQLEDAINQLAKGTAVDPVGKPSPPAKIQNLQVKNVGELFHAVITDNNPVRKGVHYFMEYDTDPSFPQPQVVHLGASRVSPVLHLPANDDNNNPLMYYFRAYPQLPGSDPGPKLAFGGNTNPTGVAPTGTTQFSLLPSTGSGTAAADGRQGGQGFGVVATRRPLGPKRSNLT